MKKNLLLFAALAISGMAFRQVGINNSEPKATLDVTAKNTNSTTAEGIIAPRLTGDELKAKDAVYLAAQKGALVYVTSAVTTPGGTKTLRVTAAGYYYFDGLVWARIPNAAETVGAVKSIYNMVGTTTQTVPVGTTVDVDGLSQTITVPAGKSSILQMTATGYASQSSTSGNVSSQGAFSILINGAKLTTGYVSSQDANAGGLVRLPSQGTIIASTTLAPGTYTIKLIFKAWQSEQQINLNAVTVPYGGAVSGDEDALKSRLTIIEFNN